MIPKTTIHPHWSTASFGDSTQPTPLELVDLGDHLGLCQRLNGRRAAVRSGAQALRGFVVTHFMTTLVTVALAAAAVWWVM
jgi:hypothetical protein